MDDPHVANIQVIYDDNVDPSKHKNDIRNIADQRLERIGDLTQMFVEGKISVF